MRVLIVEDEAKTVKFLAKGLKEEGYAVAEARDGETGLELALSGGFDVIILDVMLPKKGGVAICQALRAEGIKTPVIMLSARDSVPNRVEGLDAGADDYLTKPFSFEELTARLRSLLRRQAGGDSILRAGDLALDLHAHRARFNGADIELTAKEFTLLQLFLRRRGHILSRSAIADAAWGRDFDTETNVVDVYVTFLRRKLRQATGQDWIKTHRGQGYSFEAPGA